MAGPVEVMTTCTVRIVGLLGGQPKSIGTGFLYIVETPGLANPASEDGARYVPLLVTNRHVVAGCDEISVQFTVAPLNAAAGPDGQPLGRAHETHRLPVAGACVGHPDPNIDLCAFLVGAIANVVASRGLQLRQHFLNSNYKPDSNLRAILRAIEPIVMIGYPSGIWDSINNAAIIRRGSTATHPLVRYENKPEFLIDAACFPGSSGSPVFLYEDGMYRTAKDGLSPGTRIAFLGVLYAGPQFTAEGRLEPRPIPHNASQAPVTSFPMNLGFVIQSDEVDVLTAEVVRLVEAGNNA